MTVRNAFYLMIGTVMSLTVLPAQAENWVEITSSADGGIKQYLDADSIDRNLGSVVMSRVFEYQSPYMRRVNQKSYRSQRIQTEFDCQSRAMRQVHFSWHEESMGKGPAHHEGSSTEWLIDSFDEFTEPLWKMACE